MSPTQGFVPGADDGDQEQRCAVCERDLADHDRISRRYCQATQSQAQSRACICQKGA